MPDPYTPPVFAVLDFETTGVTPSDRVIEIAVVHLDAGGAETGRWETMVQPNRDVSNSFVHGLTPTDLADAPEFAGIAEEFLDQLTGRILVAHNAPFERRYLGYEFARAGIELPDLSGIVVDTMSPARVLLPGGPRKLSDCLDAAGLANDHPHSAMGDAAATADLFRLLLPDLEFTLLDYGPLPEWIPVPELRAARTLPRGRRGAGPSWIRRMSRAAAAPETGPAERYLLHLTDALDDDMLTDEELLGLANLAVELEIGHDDRAELHEIFLRRMAIEAWADGVISPDEADAITNAAAWLGVDDAVLADLLSSAPVGSAPSGLSLAVGDRVTFTGAMTLPRGEWETRAVAAGLDVGGVRRTSRLVVAADVRSRSGKARRAREIGVPIVDEATFARLLHELADAPAAPEAEVILTEPACAAVDEPGETAFGGLDMTAVFPWFTPAPDRAGITDAGDVAEAWLEAGGYEPLHRMSPLLAPGTRPEGLDPGQKTVAAWFAASAEPLSVSALELLDLPHVGPRRMRGFVYATVLHAIDEALARADDAADAPDAGDVENDIVGDFYGDGSGPVIAYPGPAGPVPETAPEPVGDVVAGYLRVFGALPVRETVIIMSRLSGTRTLDDLGHEFSVSRERIRQLEKSTVKELQRKVAGQPALRRLIAADYGPLIDENHLFHELPELATTIAGQDLTVLDVLIRLGADAVDDADHEPGPADALATAEWRREDGWLLLGDMEAEADKAIAALIDDYGMVEPVILADDLAVDTDALVTWLTGRGRVRLREGRLLTRTRSAVDEALAELALRGEPMTTDELMELIPGRDPRTLRNGLGNSPKAHRCRPDTWALTEWGMEKWTTITDFIRHRIEQSPDGRASIAALREEAEDIGVAVTSLNTYVASPEFAREDGYVMIAEEPAENAAMPEEAKALYRVGGTWRLLVTVNHDHLRGSGSPIPTGVPAIYGAAFQEPVEIPSRLGPQTVTWDANQTRVSTIRRFLEDLGLTEGDRVWLIFGDEFDVVPAPPAIDGLGGAEKLLNAMGLETPAETGDAPSSAFTGRYAGLEQTMILVNRALGFDDDAPRRKAVARLRHRRDDDLANLLQSL